MTNNKLKKEFRELGYELWYECKTWNLRKLGRNNIQMLGCKESAEEHLYKMWDDKNENDLRIAMEKYNREHGFDEN